MFEGSKLHWCVIMMTCIQVSFSVDNATDPKHKMPFFVVPHMTGLKPAADLMNLAGVSEGQML